MRKTLCLGLAASVLGLLGIITENTSAYSVNEAGEYAVNFAYNIYGEDGVASPANKTIRIDVLDDETIEIGSLLTDLSFTADSPEKPTNPKSESGAYYWRLSGGSDEAVETISKENFTGFCKVSEEVTISKCVRLEVVFPDVSVETIQEEAAFDAGQTSLLDGNTGAEISFGTAVPTGAILSVQELLASDTLKGDVPATLKKILDLAVVRENGETIEVTDNEMTISLNLPEELAEYKYFQIVYIVDGEIKETFPAEVVEGKIVFKTSHLSAYGIQASNKPFTVDNAPTVMATADTPETGVMTMNEQGSSSSKVVTLVAIAVSGAIFAGVMIWKKKRSHKIEL